MFIGNTTSTVVIIVQLRILHMCRLGVEQPDQRA
jgi:hypothetical protein